MTYPQASNPDHTIGLLVTKPKYTRKQNKKSLRVLNEAFIKVQNVQFFFYFTVSQKYHFIQQSKIFALRSFKFQIPVWTLLQNLCEESTAHYPTSRVRNVSSQERRACCWVTKHRPRRFHGSLAHTPALLHLGLGFLYEVISVLQQTNQSWCLS